MNIEDVIDESIVAVFRDVVLAKELVLKGGSAIRILEKDKSRLSIDADFSIAGAVEDPDGFFARVERALQKAFGEHGYDVLDFKATRRPRKSRKGFPKWWGGWLCEFKLGDQAKKGLTPESRRRSALIPAGANSSKIVLEISEHEYCGRRRKRRLKGVTIQGYTRELLVLEKLRALCQQHPEYRFRSRKNRARDFYDIYRLTEGMNEGFLARCRNELPRVFEAKEVPLALLMGLWDEAFISDQESGFREVADTVRGNVYEFDVYLEHVRYLVLQLWPDADQKAHP